MKGFIWKRAIRKALAWATTVTLLTGLFLGVEIRSAEAACGAAEWTATYFTKNAEGNWTAAATTCLAAPTGSSFGLPTVPDAVKAATTYKVAITGALSGPTGWHEFAASGGASLTVDGINSDSGKGHWIDLSSSNTIAVEFIYDAAHTNFTIAWSAAPACSEVQEVYVLDGATSRQAALVRCGADPTATGLSRAPGEFPSLSGGFTATYTGTLTLASNAWYKFAGQAGAGEVLSFTLEGEEMLPAGAADGYLELTVGSKPFTAVYTHASGPTEFAVNWETVTCETGHFLAAYYDKPDLKGRASVVRCEAMPGGAVVKAGRSAKFTGKAYFEEGTYGFTGTGTLTLGGESLSLTETAKTSTVTEGLHDLQLEVKAGGADQTANLVIANTATGVTVPRCLDGFFLQELSQGSTPVLPKTCVEMPTAGPPAGYSATWTGRVWFQGGTHRFTSSGVSGLKIDGTAVSDAQAAITEGRHDLSFTASSSGAIALNHGVVGSCPDGTFLSNYQVGGNSRFGACESRPEYHWSAANPPGVTTPFTATWTSHQAILDGGLYEFATGGNGSSSLTVDGVAGSFFDLPAVGQYAPSVGEDLPEPYPAARELQLSYASPESGPAGVSLSWSSPATGTAAPYCPEGLYRAEYFVSADLSGDPFLTTCEVRPDLTHQRWGANSIRWTGRVYMEAGSQTFTNTGGGTATLYMDGARVSVASSADGLQVQKTTWETVRGMHEAKVEWTNSGDLAFARLRVTPPGACPENAFTLRWYTDATLSTQVGPVACEGGAPMHEWGSLEPVLGAGSAFAATWNGAIRLPKGRYRFYLQSVGGVVVKINGQDLFVDYHPDLGYRPIDLWTAGPHAADAEVELTSTDPYTLSITYAKNPLQADTFPSGAALKLWWEPAGAPVLTAAKLQGSEVVLTYSDALDGRTKPGPTSFQVSTLDQEPVSVTGTSVDGADLKLALDSSFTGDAVIVRYDPAVGGSLRAQTLSSLPARNLAWGKSPDTTGGWTLDLGAVYLLSQVTVHAASGDYKIETSLDGLTYTEVSSFAEQPAARWVRLKPTGGALPAVESVEVWGVEAGAPALLPAPVAGVNPSNVALGKTATMSGDGGTEHAAERGVNGYTTRRIENRSEIWDYFSTGSATHPWWQVDLAGDYLLTSLQIYNRADQGFEEPASLEVWVTAETEAPAPDGEGWTRIFPAGDTQSGPFGGEYSPYLRIDLAAVPARHVMLRLGDDAPRSLELAEVQVYGVLATPSLIVRRDATPPALATETIGGVQQRRLDALDDYLVFHFDEDLDPFALPDPDEFQVSVDGRLVTPTSVQVYQRDVTVYLSEGDRTDGSMLVGARYDGHSIRNLSGLPAETLSFTEAKYLAVTPANLAEGKETAMSSTAGDHSAANGVDGDRYNDYFQTTAETDPWWSVDLADVYSLTKVRIFNRLDGGWENVKPLQVQTATACTDWDTGECAWETVYDNAQQNGSATFGAVRGSFLSVPLAYANARYVRVRLPGASKQLNLAEVEVHGVPAVQIFNLSLLRPVTLSGKNGKVTQVGGYYPVPGEVPPPGGSGEPEYSPANANDGKSDTYALLRAKAAPESSCECLWSWQVDLQSPYLLTGVKLTLDPTAVTALVGSTATYVELSKDRKSWSPASPAKKPLYGSSTVTVPIAGVEAQYLRIRTTDAAVGDLKLYEAMVLGFPAAHLAAGNTLTNLSRERPATIEAKVGLYTQWFNRYLTDPPAFDNLNNPQYNPAWAVDGNPTTYAELEPDPSSGALIWSVDLQEGREVLRAVITLPSNAAALEFMAKARVQIKVDETWVDVDFTKTGLVDGRTVTLPLPGLTVRFLRITSSQITNLRLHEVDIYGYAPALTP